MNFWPHIEFQPGSLQIAGMAKLFGEQHGQEGEEEVLERRCKKGQARDEEAQVRHAEERPVRQEGQEPETGDRDRN